MNEINKIGSDRPSVSVKAVSAPIVVYRQS
jgi:hypothetical protein